MTGISNISPFDFTILCLIADSVNLVIDAYDDEEVEKVWFYLDGDIKESKAGKHTFQLRAVASSDEAEIYWGKGL